MRAAKPSPLPPPLLPPLSAARARSPPSLRLSPGNPPPPPSARAPARLPRSSFLLPSRARVTLGNRSAAAPELCACVPPILTHRRAGALAARLRVSAARPGRPAPSVHRGEHSGGSQRDALGWRRSLTSLGRPAGQGRSQEPAPPAAPPVGRSPRCRPPGGSRRGGEPPEGPRRPRPQTVPDKMDSLLP
ncbi:Aminopeptidase Q [Manis pentadactyla]|nr:Aminopeptidase Q [Manis pentadactyla]